MERIYSLALNILGRTYFYHQLFVALGLVFWHHFWIWGMSAVIDAVSYVILIWKLLVGYLMQLQIWVGGIEFWMLEACVDSDLGWVPGHIVNLSLISYLCICPSSSMILQLWLLREQYAKWLSMEGTRSSVSSPLPGKRDKHCMMRATRW